jgi:protoporphyrinogen oxidase
MVVSTISRILRAFSPQAPARRIPGAIARGRWAKAALIATLARALTLRRRELLAALVGAPLGLEGCKRTSPDVGGKIRGPRLELGHRLRLGSSAAGLSIEQVSGETKRVRVLIVGAGPSGLSAAWRLEQLGISDYLVLDLERRPGGTSVFGDDGVVPHPWGAHYVPLPSPDNRALVKLLDEVGALEWLPDGSFVGAERALVRAPEERVFADGEWHEGLIPPSRLQPSDQAEFERFEALVSRYAARRDARGRRAFALPLERSSDDAEFVELDRISAKQFLERHGFRSRVLAWYVEYACRDDYGLSLERTSAWAMLFYFTSRATSAHATAPLLTWPEGNGRLVSHLARGAGERVRTGVLATDVVPREHGVSVAALDAERSILLRFEAEHVILSVPQFVAAKIVRPYREAPPEHVRAFRYAPWLVANLHLKGRPKSRGFPFAWDNVIYDSPSLGYVVATHQALSDFGPTVWTYYRPFSEFTPEEGRERLASLDHAAVTAAVLEDLGRAHQGLVELVERIDVYRWAHAMVAPVPGFVWGAARRRAREPLGRVHFAHSDLSGLSLFEEAQYWGVRAAEAVGQAMERSFEPL